MQAFPEGCSKRHFYVKNDLKEIAGIGKLTKKIISLLQWEQSLSYSSSYFYAIQVTHLNMKRSLCTSSCYILSNLETIWFSNISLECLLN